MSIKIGDKIRYVATSEDGEVVGASELSPGCVSVRFGDSFEYLIEKDRLSLIGSADFCGSWMRVAERREVCMLRLVQSLPSITATSAPCPQCGKPMNIKLVEPHPTVSKSEKHHFECRACGVPRAYTMKLN